MHAANLGPRVPFEPTGLPTTPLRALVQITVFAAATVALARLQRLASAASYGAVPLAGVAPMSIRGR